MAYADSDLVLDFYSDWIEWLRAELERYGYKAPADPWDVGVAYFNLLKRLIPVRPRRVHESPTLTCPDGVRAGYEEVVRKVRAGEDLRPHLSRNLEKRDFNDLLLNDWGIHHLHLGTEIEEDGFVKRTKHILFARFERDDAYLIDIKEHGPGADPWTDRQLLQTIADTWPTVLAPYECPGVEADDERMMSTATARKLGFVIPIVINGKVYAPTGGGMTTAKVGVVVVRAVVHRAEVVQKLEEAVVQAKERIFELARGARELHRPLRLRLEVGEDGAAFAVTEDGTLRIMLGQLR